MHTNLSQKTTLTKTALLLCAALAVLVVLVFSTGCATSSPPQEESAEQVAAVPDGTPEDQTGSSSPSQLITSVTPDEGLSYSLYFGLIDRDTGTQVLSTAEYREAIAKIFTEAGVGYTAYEATGAYPLEDGTVVENVTLVFAGIHSTEAALQALIEKAQAELNLESVYCESYMRGYGISGGVVNALE